MGHGTSRSGFSFVEVMVTSAISAVVLVAVASSFIGGIRLLKTTIATAEMAMRVRELRDKLLFHAAPSSHGVFWAGLLSGTNVVGGISGLRMNGSVLNGNSGETREQKIDLTFENWGSSKCSLLNRECSNRDWLHPGNVDLFADSSSKVPLTWEYGGISTNNVNGITNSINNIDRFYIHITGRINVSGLPVVHDERIVVPVFGHNQSTPQDGRGGLE